MLGHVGIVPILCPTLMNGAAILYNFELEECYETLTPPIWLFLA